MIVVDSSVWIDNIRDLDVDHVRKLGSIRNHEIIVGDLILLEVLRGARDDAHASKLQQHFAHMRVVAMLTPTLVPVAAQNYRHLRALGITIRKLTDLIVGTYCIENGLALLQSDRDFIPMARHLGLKLI